LNPPGEPRAMGFAGLAPIDAFLQRRRVPVIAGTLAVVILASPLLAFLPFDFNPLHLQNPKAEAVATYLELRHDPQTGANAVEAAVVTPLKLSLAGLQAALNPEPVTVATIPPELKRDWVAPDGRARVQVLPKGDPEDTAVLRKFVPAVLAVEPDATGPAAMLYEAGNTIVRAFIEAGIFALAAIALPLWITLRRVTDVLMTLVPLLLAAVVTLELCVVLDLPLNFANIIALPLLLGVGVAFKIYYIMAWRRGRT